MKKTFFAQVGLIAISCFIPMSICLAESDATSATEAEPPTTTPTKEVSPSQETQATSGSSVAKPDPTTLISTDTPSGTTDSAESKLGLSFYAGAAGFVNGSFLLNSKNDFYEGANTAGSIPSPTWGGVGGGGGAHLGIRWQFVSVDFGYEYSSDQADGKIDGNTYTIEQTTTHLPLTLRLEVPTETVRPSFFGGLNWVSIDKSSVVNPPNQPFNVDSIYEDYTAWRFGIGIEIMVTDQLRIPIRFSANYAPSDRDNLDDVLE